MFNFTHKSTCKHGDVCILPPPSSLVALGKSYTYWMEPGIRLLRSHRLRLAVEAELRELSAPTPGPKDVSIGSRWPSASPPCPLALSDTEEHTWVCTRCGRDMVTGIVGSQTPTTTSRRPGSYQKEE